MALKFSHVALSCKDQETTERFYSTHFGYRRARVVKLGDGHIVFLKRSDDAYLELFAAEGVRDGSTPVTDGPHGQGFRHIAFQTDDVDAKLASMGDDAHITLGPLDFSAFIPGWRTAWVSDPDGNIVEISQGFTDEEQN